MRAINEIIFALVFVVAVGLGNGQLIIDDSAKKLGVDDRLCRYD